MCGRCRFTKKESGKFSEMIQRIEARHGVDAFGFEEICPGSMVPVLMPSPDGPILNLSCWGFRTSKSLVINARAETAAEKPMFRDGILLRRCAIPSTGFFEWDGSRRKYLFTLPGEEILYMAGIFEIREGRSFHCILTTAANSSVREVHGRMPLVLTREQVGPWIDNTAETASFLRMTPPALEKKLMDDQISLW